MTIRVHLTDRTYDRKFLYVSDAYSYILDVVKNGVWIEERLYPAHAIVYAEVMDDK